MCSLHLVGEIVLFPLLTTKITQQWSVQAHEEPSDWSQKSRRSSTVCCVALTKVHVSCTSVSASPQFRFFTIANETFGNWHKLSHVTYAAIQLLTALSSVLASLSPQLTTMGTAPLVYVDSLTSLISSLLYRDVIFVLILSWVRRFVIFSCRVRTQQFIHEVDKSVAVERSNILYRISVLATQNWSYYKPSGSERRVLT